MRVYVAGPYTKGDVAVNVRTAVEAGDRLLKTGHLPYVPHLMHFWHMLFPGPYEQWTAMDLEWIWVCAALVRLPGDSNGADEEVAVAKRLGIPIFYSVEEFLNAL